MEKNTETAFVAPLRQYLMNLLADQEQAADEVKSSINSSSVPLDIEMDYDLEESYDYLVSSFERLADSDCIWDVTSASDVDMIKLRSVASPFVSTFSFIDLVLAKD